MIRPRLGSTERTSFCARSCALETHDLVHRFVVVVRALLLHVGDLCFGRFAGAVELTSSIDGASFHLRLTREDDSRRDGRNDCDEIAHSDRVLCAL